MGRHDGKIAIITGAGRSIGRANAKLFAATSSPRTTRKTIMKTHALTIDTTTPQALAAWWAEALGVPIGTDHGVLVTLVTPPDLLPLQFFKTEQASTQRNRVHPDFRTPDLDKETERLVSLGATVVQKFEFPHFRFTTLTDPDGNNFDLVQE